LPTVALADKRGGGHQFGHFFAVATGALRLIGSKDQIFKIRIAFLTMILVNRHEWVSLSINLQNKYYNHLTLEFKPSKDAKRIEHGA
jgi:hypothetical protein